MKFTSCLYASTISSHTSSNNEVRLSNFVISMLAWSGTQSKLIKLKQCSASAVVVGNIAASSDKMTQLGYSDLKLFFMSLHSKTEFEVVIWFVTRNLALYFQFKALLSFHLLYLISKVLVFLSSYCCKVLKSDFLGITDL